jgi:catechol 2,3-dioxygenase-like lactoylglutathione lyase family enzyme
VSEARELRFAVVFDDLDAALRLFRDVFGLRVVETLERDGGRGAILEVPAATLELFDIRHGEAIDGIEVGRPLGERVRVAVRIDDVDEASGTVAAAGAEALADVVETPWGDRNRRFRAQGLQLTLFESPTPERSGSESA